MLGWPFGRLALPHSRNSGSDGSWQMEVKQTLFSKNAGAGLPPDSGPDSLASPSQLFRYSKMHDDEESPSEKKRKVVIRVR